MAQVIVRGIFMGANLKRSVYDGKEKLACMIDIYQPDSPDTNKMVNVKCDDPEMVSHFNKSYSPMQESIELKVSVSAYRNEAYYKFIEEIAFDAAERIA